MKKKGLRGRPFLSRPERAWLAFVRLLGSFWFNMLWFLLAASPAHAEPISAGIASLAAWITGSIGGSAAVFTAVKITLYVALTVGLTYASGALTGRKQPGPPGVNGTIQGGGVVPRSILVGRYATAGSLVYAGTWGTDGDTPNAYYTQVIALSDLPMTALQEVWVGDKKGTYNTALTAITQGYPIAEFTANSRDNLWVKFLDGSQTAADSFLTSTFGSDPDYPFGAGMIGRGVAFVVVTARFNNEEFAGWPAYKFAGTGAKFYDPRLDSTNGGSGSHRFNDKSTWAYTENPIVILYNILRGVSAVDGSHLYGLEGLGAPRLPTSSWFAGMNECDVSVDDLDGDPHEQYRCGAEIAVDVEPAEMISALLMSCNGRITEIGGVYKVLVGAPGSSVFSFTDDLIVVDQPQSSDPFPTIDQALNGILATYVEPLAGWENKELPPRYNDTAITEDGENFSDVNYALVIDPGQGQRLQQAALNEAKNHRRNAHTLYPPAIVLEPLDVVTWTSTRNGYSSKAMLVQSVTLEPNLNVQVALNELDPTDYDWDPDTDPLDMLRPELISQDPPLNAAPSSLAAVGSVHSIALSWANPANISVLVTEIWRSSSSSFGGASKIAEVAAWTTRYIDSDLATGLTRWYWVRYRRVDGTFSIYEPSDSGAGASATTQEIDGSEIADGSITSLKLAGSLSGVEPVDSRADYASTFGTPTEGDLLVLTDDDPPFAKGELLRFTDGEWTDAVPAVAIVGTIPPSKLQAAYQGAYLNIDPTPLDMSAWAASPGIYRIGSLTGGGSVGQVGDWAMVADAVGGNPAEGHFATGGPANEFFIPCDPNKSYRAHMWFYNNTGANGHTDMFVQLFESDGTQIFTGGDFWWYPLSGHDCATHIGTWIEAHGEFGAGTAQTIPSNAAFMSLGVRLNSAGTAGQAWAQDIGLTEQVNQTLIGPNSVATGHLQANSVTATKIGANQVDTIHLNAGSVTAGKIDTNAVTTVKLDASAVTAAKIAANAVTAGKIDTDAVTAGTIDVGAVNAAGIIVDDLIVKNHLQVGAASANLTLTAAGPTNLGVTGLPITIVSGSMTASGRPVLISVEIEARDSSGSQNSPVIDLYIDSTAVRSWNLSVPATGAYVRLDQQAATVFFYVPSAGSHTWTLYATDVAGTGTDDVQNTIVVIDDFHR